MGKWEALVTRNIHVKYIGSISNGSKVMINIKVVQPTNQQTDIRTGQGQGHRLLFLFFIFFFFFFYEWGALVTRNLHAKYKGSILNSSKVMTNVKVVQYKGSI